MKRVFLTKKQFAEMLNEFKGSAFAQVQCVTEPKLNKYHRETKEPIPFKKVLNCRSLNIQLGYDYERQVSNREIKEGAENPTFEAQEHAWACRISKTLAINKKLASELAKGIAEISLDDLHADDLYVPYVKIRVDYQKYIADGVEIKKEELLPFLPPKSNYDNQPIENKVRVEYMKLSSIKVFVIDNTEYHIVD